MARELEIASDATSDGRVLTVSEALAIRAGRKLTRRTSEATIRRPAEQAEKNGAPDRSRPCDGTCLVKDKALRTMVTAAGRVEPRRRSIRRPRCGLTAHPTDDHVGLGGFLSAQATRLVRQAASWSFVIGSRRSPG
jgi:hypothetical protein